MGQGISRRGFLRGVAAVTGGTLLGAELGTGTAWAAGGPPILSCDEWGARPNSDVVNVVRRRPVRILVHHTATPNVPDLGRPAAVALARAIQNFHMDRRGWLDSGQHFTISRGGYVLEGRRRSLEALRSGRKQVEGAHCTGQNLVSIGIENEGTYLDADPPRVLWDRLRELCAYTCVQYGIAPTAIHGHRDFKDTACPGDRLYGELPRLRAEVGAAIGTPPAAGAEGTATWPLLRVGDRGAVVTAAQYLLRDAGMAGVRPDGRYTEDLADVVRAFQLARGGDERAGDEVTGMIAGGSWPLLARPVRRGEGGDAERAVEVLATGRSAESLPDVVAEREWQRLLAAAGPPMR
ncbi:MAG TPA: N-acetylmuramoyl-L-alanine amidase [Pseudonocardia sp.]|nr:N-acetylmuramoyl-L-alanine amidase [Pseudonocardia sp.]